MIVYLNGNWVDESDAKVSVFDRGFVFGDGVYEVIPVYGKKPFRINAHLDRLNKSLNAIDLRSPYTFTEWTTLCHQLSNLLTDGEGSLYIQVTRGASPRQHAFPSHYTPTVFAYAKPHTPLPHTYVTEGVQTVLVQDIRWTRCDIKSISLLANVLLAQEATARGATEALLVRDGYVNEGAVSNLFVAQSGRLFTAPTDHLILNGITRDVVLELAQNCAIEVTEQAPTQAQLLAADEVLLTSSTREIIAATMVDNQPIGLGRPGPIFHRLYEAFQTFKTAIRNGATR